MSLFSYNSNVKESLVNLIILLIQKFVLKLSSVLFIVCCLQFDCIMFLRSFFILTIMFVLGMMLSSNCNQFLVFQICVSIAVVSVSTSFFVFGGNDKVKILMCQIFVVFLEVSPYFLIPFTIIRDVFYVLCFFIES